MKKPKKIVAIASSGGHWTQLLRLRPAFAGHKVTYITTQQGASSQVSDKVYRICDSNQWQKLRLLVTLLQVIALMLWLRPDIVISTGAAPGYFALRLGKLLGARTLWIESLANAEAPSLATKLVQPFADLSLTQWPHLDGVGGSHYRGSVL